MAVVARSPGRRSGPSTRDEILRSATVLFTERGFEGTSMRDLAGTLGITPSALYYHFRNKDAIVLEVLAARRRDLDELRAGFGLSRRRLTWSDALRCAGSSRRRATTSTASALPRLMGRSSSGS